MKIRKNPEEPARKDLQAIEHQMFGGNVTSENARRKRGLMIVVLLLGMAATPGIPSAAADPLCVYFIDLSPCAGIDGLEGSSPRKTSTLVSTGSTNGGAQVNWITNIPDLQNPTEQPMAPGAVTAVDRGSYFQDWNVIYEGDAECVEITSNYWHSQGWMYVIYWRWTWAGDGSGGSGERLGTVQAGYIAHMEVVDAEASNQPLCDFLRQQAFEVAKTSSIFYASTHFGQWANHAGATAFWKPLSVSLCETGPVLIGGSTLSGNAAHTMTPGNFLTSGSFTIDGGSSIAGVYFSWSGKGEIKPCIDILAPG